MSDVRQQVAEHLRFYTELGVLGTSRDKRWSKRPDASTDEHRSSPIDHRSSDGSPSPAALETGFGETREPFIPVARSAAEALVAIKTDVGADCTRCKLHGQGRTQVVFGVGNPDADLMFVGEAPGADEDIQGIPFVGRAGQLLTKMIEAINLTRDQVYIANVIKCRPPGNRNPEPDEIEQCEPFLFRQIEAIEPKVIVALGSFAAKTLLKTQDSISRLRGRVYEFRGAKLIPTFHPSYLLRSPQFKREAWEDLKKARALLTASVTRRG